MAAQSGTYPNRLRDLRMQNGLSQSAAANAAGVSQGAWSQYEIGKVEMRAATRAKICEALGCTERDLYTDPDAQPIIRTLIADTTDMDPVIMCGDIVYYTEATDWDDALVQTGAICVVIDNQIGVILLRILRMDSDGGRYLSAIRSGIPIIPLERVAVSGRYTIAGVATSMMRPLARFAP